MNVYDFDGTIYDGDSTLDFYIFLLKNNKKIIFKLPNQVINIIKYFFKLISKEKTKESFYSVFQYFDNLDELINEFWGIHQIKIKKWYLQQQKPTDIIISASPFLLLEPICKRLGIKDLIASDVDKRTGKYRGKNCYGQEKVKRFKKKYNNTVINNFYTDSLADKPLIMISKNAFFVQKNKIIKYNNFQESIVQKGKRFFLNRDFIVFVFCGGMGTLTNFVFSLIISNYFNPTISYVWGYTISIFVTYYLNIKLIFHKKVKLIEFIKFVISYIPNFIILFSFVAVFLNIFYWPKIIVYALAGLLGLPLTFVLVKLFAFMKK